MKEKQSLGLIGGLGVGATIHYYKELAFSSQASGVPLDIVIAHASVARVFDFVLNGDRRGLALYLVDFIRRLEDAGATIAAVCAVTPHFGLQEVLAVSPIPIIDVFTATREAIRKRGVHRVALFGTRFVVQSELFGCIPELKYIAPRPDEIEEIHTIYSDLTIKAAASDQQYQRLTCLACELVRREGLDAIVLAGTELSLVFNQENACFPVVNCAELHLSAIKEFLGICAPNRMD